MLFTPLTTSCSLVYTSPSSPYNDIQDLRLKLTTSLVTIEARMDRQWDTMMTQFRLQTDQMTSQFNHLSVQLGTEASTPRSLTPSNLQPPPGITIPVDTETVSNDSAHAPDNSAWLHGHPLVVTEPTPDGTSTYQPPTVGACSIRYTPVAAVTPQTTASSAPVSIPPPLLLFNCVHPLALSFPLETVSLVTVMVMVHHMVPDVLTSTSRVIIGKMACPKPPPSLSPGWNLAFRIPTTVNPRSSRKLLSLWLMTV